MDDNNVSALYDALNQSKLFGNLGSQDEFKGRLQNQDNVQALYDAMRKSGKFSNAGDFGTFQTRLGLNQVPVVPTATAEPFKLNYKFPSQPPESPVPLTTEAYEAGKQPQMPTPLSPDLYQPPQAQEWQPQEQPSPQQQNFVPPAARSAIKVGVAVAGAIGTTAQLPFKTFWNVVALAATKPNSQGFLDTIKQNWHEIGGAGDFIAQMSQQVQALGPDDRQKIVDIIKDPSTSQQRADELQQLLDVDDSLQKTKNVAQLVGNIADPAYLGGGLALQAVLHTLRTLVPVLNGAGRVVRFLSGVEPIADKAQKLTGKISFGEDETEFTRAAQAEREGIRQMFAEEPGIPKEYPKVEKSPISEQPTPISQATPPNQAIDYLKNKIYEKAQTYDDMSAGDAISKARQDIIDEHPHVKNIDEIVNGFSDQDIKNIANTPNYEPLPTPQSARDEIGQPVPETFWTNATDFYHKMGKMLGTMTFPLTKGDMVFAPPNQRVMGKVMDWLTNDATSIPETAEDYQQLMKSSFDKFIADLPAVDKDVLIKNMHGKIDGTLDNELTDAAVKSIGDRKAFAQDKNISQKISDVLYGKMQEEEPKTMPVSEAKPEPDVPEESHDQVKKFISQQTGQKLQQLIYNVKDAIRGLTDPYKFTTAKRFLNDFLKDNQVANNKIYRITEQIRIDVPLRARRIAITNYLHALTEAPEGQVNDVLQEWASKTTNNRLRQGYLDATTLTPKELGVVKQVQQTFADYLKTGQEHGILQNGLENYVTSLWNVENKYGGKFGSVANGLKKTFDFGKHKKIPNIFRGEQMGFKARTKDISDVLAIYMSQMERVINTKKFLKNLTEITNESGEPLAVGRAMFNKAEGVKFDKNDIPQPTETYFVKPLFHEVPEDNYTYIHHPLLSEWRQVGWVDNKAQWLDAPLMIHKDLAKNISSYLRVTQGTIERNLPAAAWVGKKLMTAQANIKLVMLSLSQFHRVQTGTHAMWHRTNPISNIPAIDLEHNLAQQDAVAHSLWIAPSQVELKDAMEGLNQMLIWEKIPYVGTYFERFNAKYKSLGRNYANIFKPLFTEYIPGLKYKCYENILGRNLKLYADEINAGKCTIDDIKYMTANQVNASFGMLNYTDMGRNKTLQNLMKTFLLAPDFLEARTRFALQGYWGTGGAFKGKKSAATLFTGANEQAQALAFNAAAQYITARIINGTVNYYTPGIKKFDTRPDKPFSVVVGKREYSMRSMAGDLFNLYKNPNMFIQGRLSPIFGKMIRHVFSQTDYRGVPQSWMQLVKEISLSGIPIAVSGAVPGAQRNLDVGAYCAALNSMGINASRFSPINDMMLKADKWLDANNLQKQTGSFPPSPFRTMRNALEDDNMKLAVEQYNQLANDRAKTLANQAIVHGIKNAKPEDYVAQAKIKLRTAFFKSLSHGYTNNADNDQLFKNSLNWFDQQEYDSAEALKVYIRQQFSLMLDQANESHETLPDMSISPQK